MTTFTVTNSHQLAIVVASLVGVTLATICVALRFRARRLRKQPTEFDDWFCVAALVSVRSYLSDMRVLIEPRTRS